MVLRCLSITFMFQEADKDDSGTVDFHEFVNLMAKRETEKETEEDLKQVFRVFDKVSISNTCQNKV